MEKKCADELFRIVRTERKTHPSKINMCVTRLISTFISPHNHLTPYSFHAIFISIHVHSTSCIKSTIIRIMIDRLDIINFLYFVSKLQEDSETVKFTLTKKLLQKVTLRPEITKRHCKRSLGWRGQVHCRKKFGIKMVEDIIKAHISSLSALK